MRILRFFLSGIILSLTLVTPLSLTAQEIKREVLAASDAIDYDYFFRHLNYLSCDEIKGRGVGSPGYNMAANYVAGEFEKNGLVPFGDNGGYFQSVALVKTSIEKGSFQLRVENNSEWITADYGADVSVVLNPKAERVDERQQVAFVGYGNILPEKGINDYDGVDVRGMTVVVALGGPKGMEDPVFNDRNTKFDNAVSSGASGIILFYPRANLLQNVIFRQVHGFLSKEMLSLVDPLIESSIGNDSLRLLLFAKKRFVKELFTLNGLSLQKELRNIAKGKHGSKVLGSLLNCHYDQKNDSIVSKNVVALMTGSDPRLRNEYVVFGAHLDHFGIGKPVKGDSIYNGMLDNASGVSALLTISRTFSELAESPKRSVVFVSYTAEENGLLGSSFFANRNPIDDGKIVANVNVDMLAQTIETADMAPLGYSHSNLSEAADFAANALNLKIDDNKQAEFDYIERSDQISFIKKGIPALFITGGFTALDPQKNGEKVFKRWMKKTYHSPFDDLDQEYSDQAFLTAIRFNFLTTYYIANAIKEIKWNKNSWLYEKYISDAK